MLKEIKNLKKFNELISNNKYVIVDFYAIWCPPCEILSLTFKEAAKEINDVVFVKVEIDHSPEIEKEYIKGGGIPQILFFKNGIEVARHDNFAPKEVIIDFINKYK